MKRPVRVRVESLRGTVPLVVRLPSALHRALLAEKKRTGRTVNLIVRTALEARLARRKQQ